LTYAITKADLLLQGEGGEAENMAYGSTLSQDGFRTHQFDFMLSNPPYGKSWKSDLERMGSKDGVNDSRFIISHGGDNEFNLLTRSSDGQLLFLVNKLSKMKESTTLGSRIAEVHNGSALTVRDEAAAPVIKKLHKPGKIDANPLYGRYEVTANGKPHVAEYEPDSELRDTEQVPLLENGGIEAFVRREVLPHVPDAWVDADATKIGYEISFTRYFYKPQPDRCRTRSCRRWAAGSGPP